MHYLKFYKILENGYKSGLFSLGIKSFLENARCLLNIIYLNCKPSKERPDSRIKSGLCLCVGRISGCTMLAKRCVSNLKLKLEAFR